MTIKFLTFILVTILFTLSFSTNIYSDDVADTKYWIYFVDKGKFKPNDKITKKSEAYKIGKELLTERAIKRRLKVLNEDNLIDFADLPLNESYVNEIEKLGIELIATSRWLSGVSAYLTKRQLEKVKNLDFVSQIQVVNKLYKQEILSYIPYEHGDNYNNILFESNSESSDTNNVYDYGKSYNQMEQIDVPKVHNMNITGEGVLIASLDDGFDWRNHEALKNLKILDEYDFINKDGNTFPEENQKYEDSDYQGGHGTATLSSLAGFKEGKLIGPAFNSEFILAKSEYITTETPMEEDFWLEAAEWVEAKGVDIITSSLIYKDYDDPYIANSYTYENYDGNTAVTTIAGDRAAYLGIVVLNAMGNYYQTAIPSLGSAADGDSIISVGAVMFNGNIAGFSSNGPTSDGRIKPDVVAQGVSVYVASIKTNFTKANSYEFSGGTSFSTPITAGVCALILSVHPELTPMEVKDALRNTASLSNNPNNIMGWGIINAYNAILFHGMAWSNRTSFISKGNDIIISTHLASKNLIDLNSVRVYYSIDNENSFKDVKLNLFESNNDGNNSGEYSAVLDDVSENSEVVYYFYAKDFSGIESYYPKDAPNNYLVWN
ncbi:MAG: S8 family serine peptidase [Ignavibacteria bacterium]|nr:S8 family serine peptidase [Ignavibacteria bacterium]